MPKTLLSTSTPWVTVRLLRSMASPRTRRDPTDRSDRQAHDLALRGLSPSKSSWIGILPVLLHHRRRVVRPMVNSTKRRRSRMSAPFRLSIVPVWPDSSNSGKLCSSHDGEAASRSPRWSQRRNAVIGASGGEHSAPARPDPHQRDHFLPDAHHFMPWQTLQLNISPQTRDGLPPSNPHATEPPIHARRNARHTIVARRRERPSATQGGTSPGLRWTLSCGTWRAARR